MKALVAMLNEQGRETESSIIQTAELKFEKKLTDEISQVRIGIAESEKRFE